LRLKIARIGNSKGISLAAWTLKRYQIGATLLLEKQSDGIMLRPTGPVTQKLDWIETARAIAAEQENWNEWDSMSADGLN
jgi:antitoxin component of MazEF toxin-antitoxin module